MIDLSRDIHSLSDFKRKTAQFRTRMKKTGNPVVLTINGKAEMIVQDAASYQRLLDRAERIEMMEFLRESRADMEAGRTKPAGEALEELGRTKKAATPAEGAAAASVDQHGNHSLDARGGSARSCGAPACRTARREQRER